MMAALKAEILKNRKTSIVAVTFIAFALAPVMGAVFILIFRDQELVSKAGLLKLKADAMGFKPDWQSYMIILTQAVSVGGILVFGFIASWIFGREYSDGTSKDLLALPTSRSEILDAKFITYGLWCLCLAVSNLVIGVIIGSLFNVSGSLEGAIVSMLPAYTLTTLMTILIGTPVAFFAIAGEGYLLPLGFVALVLVLAQIIAAIGFGNFFPWSIPGLYSGVAGDYKEELNIVSYLELGLVSALGYLGTKFWWQHADQTR